LAGLSIGVIGTDGSGKTTLVNKLVEELNRSGFPTKKVWFRFPHFLTFSLLFIAKLTGFTKYKSDGKHRVAIHYFQARPFRILYPALVFVDVIAHYIVKVWIPSKLGYILVFDRWIPDVLIDIAIDTRNSHFFHTLFGRLLYSLTSRTTIIILVDASDQVLNARRPEASLDPYTYKRRLFYRLFSSFLGACFIRGDVDLDTMWKDLQNSLEKKTKIHFGTSRRTKVYGDTMSPLLRRLFKNKYVILASNWIFQGMLMRTWSERLFRFVFELISVLIIFVLFSFYLPQIPAIILSTFIIHTLNWIFNGNLWALLMKDQRFLKSTGRRGNIARKIQFLANLKKRATGAFGSIVAVAVFGSLSRAEFDETSDIDMRIIRNSGIFNCVKVNIFAVYLRFVSFIQKIPLDLYVLDGVNQIERHMSLHEPPIVIYDPTNALGKIYGRTIPLREVVQSYQNR